MTDNIVELLEQWGAWARDHHDGLGCKSPSQMLMLQAPKADTAQESKYQNTPPYISDDDALVVDKAVGKLHDQSPVLGNILALRYRDNMSLRQITRYYITPMEYPHQASMDWNHKDKKKVCHKTVGKMLSMAIDETERLHGLLIKDIC